MLNWSWQPEEERYSRLSVIRNRSTVQASGAGNVETINGYVAPAMRTNTAVTVIRRCAVRP